MAKKVRMVRMIWMMILLEMMMKKVRTPKMVRTRVTKMRLRLLKNKNKKKKKSTRTKLQM